MTGGKDKIIFITRRESRLEVKKWLLAPCMAFASTHMKDRGPMQSDVTAVSSYTVGAVMLLRSCFMKINIDSDDDKNCMLPHSLRIITH